MSFWLHTMDEPDYFSKVKKQQESIKKQYALEEFADVWLQFNEYEKEAFVELIHSLGNKYKEQVEQTKQIEPDVNMKQDIYSKNGNKVGTIEIMFKYGGD